ncbi:permease prefix domain 1-containing protein [Enterococcus ureasiticus]|uniref:Beta-carotene 15,15'-monooxygenase n=1 Tax=Enterococcus ureasiticus TaxID=903984 RepID=A0A1E5GMH5_9ENTE|nr:permease prefix domain 1-containing protein [Enterococcus ureasiticus]OEG13805.1 hypothetical protein BCR21_02090 [Enterococcus ureasiticus]
MKTIQDYIDSLFLGIAETSQTKQLKEDLLASAEDRYEDLKKQGKSENEAIGSVISEFGSIDELVEEMNIKQDFINAKGYELDSISLEETIDFIKVRRRGATLIGLGVMVILLGVAALFGFMTLYGESLGESFGLLFVLLGAAIGVPLFIIAGTSMANFNKKLNDRFISIQVKNEVKKRKEAFQRSFIICIVIGVALCILSVIPLVVLSEIYNSEVYEFFGIACLLVLVSFGVFFFIFGGVIMGSFTKMLEQTYFISDEGKLGPRAKAERDRKKPVWFQLFEKIYWPIIVAIFLYQGFLLGNWGTNWIIFPIAGIAFGILESIFSKNE